MKKLFVYGTLMNDEVLARVLNQIPKKQTASLMGYQCLMVAGEVYPAIRPNESARVEGELLEDLSQEDMDYLDIYEGDAYFRRSVGVKAANGSEIDCETYIYKPEYQHMLSDQQAWSNEYFRKHHLVNFLDGEDFIDDEEN